MVCLLVVLVTVGGVISPPMGYAISETEVKQQQIQQKIEYIAQLADKLTAAHLDLNQISASSEAIRKEQQSAKAAFDKAKDEYERASKSVEFIKPEVMANLTQNYQEVKKKLDTANTNMQTAEYEVNAAQQTLNRLATEKQQTEVDIQSLKGDLFDLAMQEKVWVEGYGEAVQSEDKSPIQCKELALTIAKRDAVERGGKALIESLTKVELLQVKEDTITVTSYAQIVSSDDSGDYGKFKKITEGDITKFVVKVRLQIMAAGAPNPFRQQVIFTQRSKVVPSIQQSTIQSIDNKPVNDPSDMVLVEGGTFRMGDTMGDGFKLERPIHNVTVRSFYIGKNEVTFNEYDTFCEATGRSKPSDQRWGRGERPVIHVSWYDAIDYCNWRSRMEGLQLAYIRSGNNVTCDFNANGYRLPTEAEWEYAARGGQQCGSYKYSGSNNPDDVAWSWGNSGQMTHPVGQKGSNELGIYDMSGNVWEWCWDWYGDYSSSEADNPQGASAGAKRVYRGGSWFYDVRNVRVSYRCSYDPANSDSNIGFRLTRTY
ncbi:MAG: SUMF1/EgtB/PvdO family nonheme iron enzyme [Pelosinus sp.]|nr:SUMF1/EgtB/PvdO family nonheme iron enzyme [Pelosinus sp.]